MLTLEFLFLLKQTLKDYLEEIRLNVYLYNIIYVAYIYS